MEFEIARARRLLSRVGAADWNGASRIRARSLRALIAIYSGLLDRIAESHSMC